MAPAEELKNKNQLPLVTYVTIFQYLLIISVKWEKN